MVTRRKRLLKPDDSTLIESQAALAETYINMGNGHYQQAAELLEQVIEIRERMLAPDNPSLLASQCDLALAYFGMGSGHYEKAAGLLEQVVVMAGRTLAPEDPRLLQSQQLLEMVQEHIEAEKNAKSKSASEKEV